MRSDPSTDSEKQQRRKLPAVLSARNAVVFGILAVTFMAAVREISPARSWTFLRQFYGIFVFCYWNWILWHEYTWFSTLHELKSPGPDTLLVASLAVSLRSFILAPDLVTALWWLAVFLGCACLWEIYTMQRGYKKYFRKQRSPLDANSWISLLGAPLLPFRVPIWTHWNEYRYWLVLDLSGLIVLVGMATAYTPHQSAESDSLLTPLLVLGLTVIGLVNIFRYRTVLRSTKRRGLSQE
jgi:hypothetical protein